MWRQPSTSSSSSPHGSSRSSSKASSHPRSQVARPRTASIESDLSSPLSPPSRMDSSQQTNAVPPSLSFRTPISSPPAPLTSPLRATGDRSNGSNSFLNRLDYHSTHGMVSKSQASTTTANRPVVHTYHSSTSMQSSSAPKPSLRVAGLSTSKSDGQQRHSEGKRHAVANPSDLSVTIRNAKSRKGKRKADNALENNSLDHRSKEPTRRIKDSVDGTKQPVHRSITSKAVNHSKNDEHKSPVQASSPQPVPSRSSRQVPTTLESVINREKEYSTLSQAQKDIQMAAMQCQNRMREVSKHFTDYTGKKQSSSTAKDKKANVSPPIKNEKTARPHIHQRNCAIKSEANVNDQVMQSSLASSIPSRKMPKRSAPVSAPSSFTTNTPDKAASTNTSRTLSSGTINRTPDRLRISAILGSESEDEDELKVSVPTAHTKRALVGAIPLSDRCGTPLNRMTQEKVFSPPPQRQVEVMDNSPSSSSTESSAYSPPSTRKQDNTKTRNKVPRRRDYQQFLKKFENEPSGTLLVYQPTCLDHHTDNHQENRRRLHVLCGPDGVLLKDRFKNLTWANLDELKPAKITDLLRVHTPEYIRHLDKACQNLQKQDVNRLVGPLHDSMTKPLKVKDWMSTEHAKVCNEEQELPSGGSFDSDSPISQSSYEAAKLAAGSVCYAVDKVLRQETRNAFVVVRPPGHHAGPNGSVLHDGLESRPDMCTCGFCLLNNVCIGAAYALYYYQHGATYAPVRSLSHANGDDRKKTTTIQKIAIVDFDIHHGNGTEECVRNLIPHRQKYPLPPSWAPVEFDSYRPWRDENDLENVFFASIHLFDDEEFYPGSGKGPHGCTPELRDRKNILNLPLNVLGPEFLEERLKLSSRAKRELMQRASNEFRKVISEKLLPALREFNPDLVFLSAGFDGHADDFYYYLSEDDYGWVTDELTQVADDCCEGRVVSVLEGGYNIEPDKAQRPKPVNAKRWPRTSNFHHAAQLHNRELDNELLTYGSLARSCASHVSALLKASGS